MQTTRISFDGQSYQLPEDSDLPTLIENIEQAARNEPTFVTFVTADGLTSVLVGAHTSVAVNVTQGATSSAFVAPPVNWTDWDV